MNTPPKISIIIPIYNIEKYIAKCIDSVIAQTFTEWELILVNDGSTDNSGKICDEYALKDSRIKVIHKGNEGVTATRDRGVKESKGEFLFFIDGDDYISENALELFINKQKENDVDLVRGSFCKISEKGEISREYITNKNINTKEEWFEYIVENAIWSIWNNLIKKEIYCKYVNVPNDITLGEDLISSSQLAIGINTINYNNIITYFYIQRCSSAMHTTKYSHKGRITYLMMVKELDKICKEFKKLKSKTLSKILEYLICGRTFLNLIDNKEVLKKHKKEVFKLYIKYFALNYNVQLSILKKSWKCYLYNWWSITKFI